MSKIYKRPMFRGGGKVSSYGNGIATGLADGGMANKRGLVDGPGGYAGIDTKSGFRNSPAYKFGSAGLDAIGKVFLDPLNYVANPVANAFNKGIVNPLAGLFGYGDLMKRVETPYDNKYLFGGEKFGEPTKYEIDSGAIPKAILENEKEEPISIEERIAKIQAEERKKYQDMIDKAMGTKDKRSAKEQIAENKELFEEVMGGGKSAKIQDLSDMGLSFAGKALKEGATVKSAFAEFFEDESKRPSRKSKVSDAASSAAINAYLTGEKSYNDLMKALKVNQAGIDYKAKVEQDAKKALTINDYVVADKTGSTNKAIANGARKVIENNNLGTQGLQIISKEDASNPELLVEENVGEVFMDEDNQVVFQIIIQDGVIGKKYLYR